MGKSLMEDIDIIEPILNYFFEYRKIIFDTKKFLEKLNNNLS